ncbi:MAG: BrnA antitoxin family protein [Bdellovibrionaceae bacterium]|nr:BrnA antitoxin family protein [Pseudobdellovibrionaceae bacterium]
MTGKIKKKKIKYGDEELDRDEFDVKNAKFRVTAFVDSEVVEALRKQAKTQGKGYQTLMNEILREAVLGDSSYESRLKKLEKAVFKKRA